MSKEKHDNQPNWDALLKKLDELKVKPVSVNDSRCYLSVWTDIALARTKRLLEQLYRECKKYKITPYILADSEYYKLVTGNLVVFFRVMKSLSKSEELKESEINLQDLEGELQNLDEDTMAVKISSANGINRTTMHMQFECPVCTGIVNKGEKYCKHCGIKFEWVIDNVYVNKSSKNDNTTERK